MFDTCNSPGCHIACGEVTDAVSPSATSSYPDHLCADVCGGREVADNLPKFRSSFVLKVSHLIGEHGEVNSIKEVNLISLNVSVLTSPLILQASYGMRRTLDGV